MDKKQKDRIAALEALSAKRKARVDKIKERQASGEDHKEFSEDMDKYEKISNNIDERNKKDRLKNFRKFLEREQK